MLFAFPRELRGSQQGSPLAVPGAAAGSCFGLTLCVCAAGGQRRHGRGEPGARSAAHDARSPKHRARNTTQNTLPKVRCPKHSARNTAHTARIACTEPGIPKFHRCSRHPAMLSKPEALKEVFKKRVRKCIRLYRLPLGVRNELWYDDFIYLFIYLFKNSSRFHNAAS